MPISFTYHGDLLGISGLYRLGPDIAYEKLKAFYNCVFSCFERYCHITPDIKVTMFSDSLLVWGPDAKVHKSSAHQTTVGSTIKMQLEEIKYMLKRDIGEHYTETLGLLRRSEQRKRFTDNQKSIGL